MPDTEPRLRRTVITAFVDAGEDLDRPHPAEVRAWATGEHFLLAREEIDAAGELIPAARWCQAEGEAQLLGALIDGYGLHRPRQTGGPFGILAVTPRHDELRIRLSHRQLQRWVEVLAYTCDPQGRTSSRGVAGLRWTAGDTDTVLTIGCARIVLAGVSAVDWCEALEAVAPSCRPRVPGLPEIREAVEPVGEAERADGEQALGRLDGLVWQLSATLRRIRLLTDPSIGAQAVELLIGEHRGRPHLLDATGGFPRAVPLWASLSLPLELWPPAPPEHTSVDADPRMAVLQVVREAGGDADAEPEQALCVLAGLPQMPLTLQAARTALKVAGQVLADPACASLADGGGWAGNRRRDSALGCIAHEDEPTLAPGTEQLVDEADMLGMLSEGRILDDYVLPTGDIEVDPAIHGREALAGLIDWALAAATRPSPWAWSRDPDEEAWNACEPLNGPLAGQILLTAGPLSYAVHVECDELDEDGWETECEYAPSAAAAILLAEHAAIEAAAGLRYQRDGRKWRLLLPEQVPPTAQPTVTELIATAHEDQVLDFPGLAAALTHLAFRIHVPTTGASGGYWRRGVDDAEDLDYIHSVMGYLTDYCGTPATDDGEPANTTTVDSPVYLRHLARHRAALDPFVTCYLAAAEGADGELDFAQRHRLGAMALKAADLTELARLDPRPVPERTLDLAASIPLEVTALASWFDAHCQS